MATQSAAAQIPYQTPSYFPIPFHLQSAAAVAGAQAVAQQSAVAPAYTPVAPVYPAVYSFPPYNPAQQLFQKDAQTITPEALASVKAAIAKSSVEKKVETKAKAVPRKAAGQTWEDPTLADWPEIL